MANFICPHCGTSGEPENKVEGSFGMEILLWLLGLLPGLIYTLWRMSSKKSVCPKCQLPGMIPSDTPAGLDLQKKFGKVLAIDAWQAAQNTDYSGVKSRVPNGGRKVG